MLGLPVIYSRKSVWHKTLSSGSVIYSWLYYKYYCKSHERLRTTNGKAEWDRKRLFFYFWREYVKPNNHVNVTWIVWYTSENCLLLRHQCSFVAPRETEARGLRVRAKESEGDKELWGERGLWVLRGLIRYEAISSTTCRSLLFNVPSGWK